MMLFQSLVYSHNYLREKESLFTGAQYMIQSFYQANS